MHKEVKYLRYKVVTKYPGTHWYVGTILDYDPKKGHFARIIATDNSTPMFSDYGIKNPEMYPKIFKEI